ncbi:MAG: FAD-binding oxidoreductase [Myxococcales bacterium]|nr:FAD-binding oxidoreductase [Myxococcales bacterium]
MASTGLRTTESTALAPSGDQPTIEPWGRIGGRGVERFGEDLERLSAEPTLCRGLGRSYGDSSLPAGPIAINTTLANRILAWDPQTGVLRAEAGLSLYTMNRMLLPHGWFSPVSPGTQFVTLGGMVASDVHGKNHHVAGCFGHHVRALRMRVADGRLLEVTQTQHADLFWATVGGMGWTGAILEVEVQMTPVPSPWIEQHTEQVGDLESLVARLKEVSRTWPMTMSWIDCLKRGKHMGRGIVYYGRWAQPDLAPKTFPKWNAEVAVPIDAPSWALNPLTMGLFNFGVYRSHIPRHKHGIVTPETFYYPLDRVLDWNRAYGKSGFTQYQCVIPDAAGMGAVVRFMEALTQTGAASFLCVMKDCGPEGQGLLSFPTKGTSIAVDIPVKSGTAEVVATLNKLVIGVGGRVYLTKDRFTTADDFAAMEPRLDAFREARAKWDPQLRFASAQSVRLLGDSPSGAA